MSDDSQTAPALDLAAVRHVAKLARLAIPESQLEPLQHELIAILGHISQLQQVNTNGLEPMAHPLTLVNRLGDDVAVPGMAIAELLRNAPSVEGDFLAVPKVLTGESS